MSLRDKSPIGTRGNWVPRESYGVDDFSRGFTGLMVTFRLNVEKGGKFDDFKWTYSYGLSLDIEHSKNGMVT